MLLSAYMQIFSFKIQCTALLDRMNLKLGVLQPPPSSIPLSR